MKPETAMFPTNLFKEENILVGITGGIAAYKSIELIRYLVTQKANVRVIMTASAEKFVTRLTLETLSQNPVSTEMFPANDFHGTYHIHWADWAEVTIIVPATYNFIGKLYSGIADDLLTTTVAALHRPVVIAPAMNVNMWNNPLLQRNLDNLANHGYLICPPEEGFLAEGYSGMGRLARLDSLIQYLYRASHPSPKSLQGKNVLITAGRTEEKIDPVRYLSNRSSGKMGFALAWEAFARGADVTLVHGPGFLASPASIQTVAVTSASEMFDAVQKQIAKADIYIGAAAIADFTPAESPIHKIKKTGEIHELSLKPTTDILQFIGQNKKKNQKLVGFAVETENGPENAVNKLKTKNLDMVVLNNPLEENAGFNIDTNKVVIYRKNKDKRQLPVLPKLDVAFQIFDFLLSK
jgi:phosphopantothenoylcysteine decarboxylase/phosphopantothenate--cysteine ligase